MTKEEKIQESYGKHWEKLHPIAKKCALDNYGWISSLLGNPPKDLCLDFDEAFRIYRPKSLEGIEENNGWIKLNGLPNEIEYDGDIWIINKNGDIEINVNHECLEIGYATHYQFELPSS